MAKDWAKGFYNSKAWQGCRESYIAKRIGIDGGLCECCHAVCGEEVHHVIKLERGNIGNPEVALNHDNLQLLCSECHLVQHRRDRLDGVRHSSERGVWFDEDGGVHLVE